MVDGAFVTTGSIERGRFKMRHAERFATWAKARQPGEFVVTVERLRATRSSAQNRLYWSFYVGTVSDHTGYSPEEVHAIFKHLFLPKQLAVADAQGELVGEFVVGGSTTTLTADEFSTFLRAIQVWAAENLDCYIPDTNEL